MVNFFNAGSEHLRERGTECSGLRGKPQALSVQQVSPADPSSVEALQSGRKAARGLGPLPADNISHLSFRNNRHSSPDLPPWPLTLVKEGATARQQ